MDVISLIFHMIVAKNISLKLRAQVTNFQECNLLYKSVNEKALINVFIFNCDRVKQR